MPSFTCTTCGAAFTLPPDVLARYPGWVPKRCTRCRKGGGARRAPVEDNLTLREVLDRYTAGPQDGVFTDGSAVPNPGPGGWGAVYVRDGELVDQRHGHAPDTTNNRMELRALIEGFDLVPPDTPTVLYSDSRLVVDTVTQWAAGWARRGWTRKTGPVQNLDLVKEAYARAQERPDITVRWIKAHDGSRWNEYADALATAWMREEP
jgi:ribonuclease HI